MGSDPEPRVREAAARALGEIGDRRALPVLERALNDETPAIRVYAIEAIGALKAAELAPKLATLLEEDKNPSVREAAAVTLGKAGGGESLPVLIRVLDDKDEKLVQLASSSIITISRREEKLLEPTADKLVEVGHPGEGATLYELLAEKLAEKKDEKRLISVRVKLADAYLAAKQWMKAAPLLEELTKTLPDDIGLAEKRARTLTQLRKHVEALRVYQALAARNGAGGYWTERLALLEEMLKDAEAAEATKVVDEILDKEKQLPDDSRRKLVEIRTRAAEMVRAAEQARQEEIRRLIEELGSADAAVRTPARTKLKERGEETYPFLVETLDRADEKVRRLAVELLRELTKQNFGYRPEASLTENAEAIRKWKAWVAAKKPG
ncbi:MAG: hypothetical protein AMS16_04215 [Planctomycetes bacterium DG_58]|nr:MAG: hypothetical protein AMS16_04215 [Planctomycetes bacterium DG_58]